MPTFSRRFSMAAKDISSLLLLVSKQNILFQNRNFFICGSKCVARNFSSASVPSIHQLRQEISQLVSEKASLTNIAQDFEKDQLSIRPRRMRESSTAAMIPLKNNPELQQKYRTAFNTVRIGMILEDLDTLAGLTCFHHNKKNDSTGLEISPVAFVTAMVDSVDVHPETKQTFVDDIRLSGMATWVGRSSVLVSMVAEQLQNDQWKSMVSAKFIMVGRSVVTNTSAKVNPLVVETEEERLLFAEGEANKIKAEKAKSESLLKMAPNAVEREYVHKLFLETIEQGNISFSQRICPENSVWMETTKLKNMIICQPERRNMYGKIFGGFLMREAFELAWANASVLSKSRPRCIAIDDISFKRPVEIGDLLYLSSEVVYTEGQNVQTRVWASVVDPVHGTQETSNIFYFTFRVERADAAPAGTGPQLPRIVPRTYAEAMLLLDGKRHYEASVKRQNLVAKPTST